MPFTARVERAHSYRARSASKKGTWPLLSPVFKMDSARRTPGLSDVGLCDSSRHVLLRLAPSSLAQDPTPASLNRPEMCPVLQARDRLYPAHRGYGPSVPALARNSRCRRKIAASETYCSSSSFHAKLLIVLKCLPHAYRPLLTKVADALDAAQVSPK